MRRGDVGTSLPALKTHRATTDPQARAKDDHQGQPGITRKSNYWHQYSTLLSARNSAAQRLSTRMPSLKPPPIANKKDDAIQDRQQVHLLDEWRPVNNSLQQRNHSVTSSHESRE